MIKRMARWCFILSILSLSGYAESISQDLITVSFDGRDQTTATKTLDVLSEALRQFEKILPAGTAPIMVHVCHSNEEFKKDAGWHIQREVGGISKPEKGFISVKAHAIQPSSTYYPGILRHELLHILLERNTDDVNLPRWLNEGICMVYAGEYRWASMYRIAMMQVDNRLIEYRFMNLFFVAPGSEQEFGDAYAQSLSMTKYMIRYVGENVFWNIIADMKTIPFDQSLEQRAGITPYRLFNLWKRSLWKSTLITSIVSGVTIFQIMALLTIFAFVRKYRRGKRLLLAWDQEEEENDEQPSVSAWDLEQGVEDDFSDEED